MEAIDSIKIVQVDGLTNGGRSGGGSGANGAQGGSGNLAGDAVNAALAYRAQAPVLDGLMKELGLDGSSLGALVAGAAADIETPSEPFRPNPKVTQADPVTAEPDEAPGKGGLEAKPAPGKGDAD